MLTFFIPDKIILFVKKKSENFVRLRLLASFRRFVFFVTFLLSQLCFSIEPNFVTYEFSGGRFGDNLLTYMHAKWISYRYQIPLLYKPFSYSSQLVLHEVEFHYDQMTRCKAIEVLVESEADIAAVSKDVSKFYLCPYFPECKWERENTKGGNGRPFFFFDVDWKNPKFRAILKRLIAPKQKYRLILPPKGVISIALHIREGGGFDVGEVPLYFLAKMPPIQFYTEGLVKVVELFKGKPLYCFVFTDALDPDSLVNKLKSVIPEGTEIIFECRSKGNCHDSNVLEDFFSFFHFDVLIHSQSNFSIIPSLIHDYAVTYAPLSAYRKGSFVGIDNVKFEINKDLYERLMK